MPGVGGLDTELIGSAGTLVAAGLQTAGHHVQAAMLDMLEAGLGAQIGMLLYVIAALAALMTIGLGGHYKFGLWFLIGPALFYQLTVPRVVSKGVVWRFGDNVHETEVVYQVAEGIVDGETNGTPEASGQAASRQKLEQGARVSFAFAYWDLFTTEIIQRFIAALRLTDVKSDMDFISKSERYVKVFDFK